MKQEQAYLTCFKIIRIERAGVKFLEKNSRVTQMVNERLPLFPGI